MDDCDAKATSSADHGRSSTVAQRCPSCGAALRDVLSSEVGCWLCPECGRCWEAESEGLRRLDPSSCRGCNSQLQAACLEILETDLWHFANETPPAEKPEPVQP